MNPGMWKYWGRGIQGQGRNIHAQGKICRYQDTSSRDTSVIWWGPGTRDMDDHMRYINQSKISSKIRRGWGRSRIWQIPEAEGQSAEVFPDEDKIKRRQIRIWALYQWMKDKYPRVGLRTRPSERGWYQS